jgi:response regulator RpfG family c-di-GMP phosphodiesterase
MTTGTKIKVIYVDDEENNLLSFKASFRMKYEVFIAISAKEAITILQQNPEISVIITDQRMPDMTGVEFLESILDIFPDPIRILLTGYADINAVIDAVNKGKIYHYLSKPWKEEELSETIEKAHELYEYEISQKEYNKQIIRVNDQLEFLLRQRLLS